MKCKHCDREMKALFTSMYCGYCESRPRPHGANIILRAASKRIEGYAKWIMPTGEIIRLVADKRNNRIDMYWNISNTKGIGVREITKEEVKEYLKVLINRS